MDKWWRTSWHSDRIGGAAFTDEAIGKDREDGDAECVGKIVPWVICTVNDNGGNVFSSWESDMSFPIVSNNTFYSLGRNNCSLRNAGEWDNVHFIEKGISLSADKTINSLAYNSGETAPYPNNLVLGAGRTLTIRSGGLIMARTGRWLGCTQTSKFAENGTVASPRHLRCERFGRGVRGRRPLRRHGRPDRPHGRAPPAHHRHPHVEGTASACERGRAGFRRALFCGGAADGGLGGQWLMGNGARHFRRFAEYCRKPLKTAAFRFTNPLPPIAR